MDNPEHYCALYVDTALSGSDILRIIQAACGGHIDGDTLIATYLVADLRMNEDSDASRITGDAGDFLFFPYKIDAEPLSEEFLPNYKRALGSAISQLRQGGAIVVPACTFEDELS